MANTTNTARISPLDDANVSLLSHVHPESWENPTPIQRYNLVVIGAGTAGLVSAAGTAGLGGKVALIEKNLMGGDCLNVGCVPSKALIACAKRAAQVRDAAKYGVSVSGSSVNFGKVMQRMRVLRAQIAPVDGAERFTELGVDVFLGAAKFVAKDEVEVGGVRLRFARCIIATGARAFVPPIAGLKEFGYLTNHSLFELTELPSKLTVIGGGPIGCEMAQCFARFGSQVTLVDMAPQILFRDDTDAAAVVRHSLENDGVRIVTGASIQKVTAEGTLQVTVNETNIEIPSDAILVATGRRANTEGLGLEVAGVEFNKRGVVVDKRLRTSNKKVYAVGDVASQWQFTHAADALARIAIQNSLFFGRKSSEDLVVPRVTYTDPELASVGKTKDALDKENVEYRTFEVEFSHVDRAIVEEHTEGFLRVYTEKTSDTVLGATIVGQHAGELLSPITHLMTHCQGLSALAKTIQAYPTLSLGLKQLADQFARTRLTARTKKILNKILSWRR